MSIMSPLQAYSAYSIAGRDSSQSAVTLCVCNCSKGRHMAHYISREASPRQNVYCLIVHSRIYLQCVCLSVPCRIPTVLHGPGCNLGEWQGPRECSLVVHYQADLQSVHGFSYDNSAEREVSESGWLLQASRHYVKCSCGAQLSVNIMVSNSKWSK